MLSACVLTRNEEPYIGRLLASLAGCPDVVVLDTGSTDGTLSVVARFPGVTVRRFAWTGDFSEARNAATAHARHEWVLWLDADMWFPPGELARLLAFLPQVPAHADGLGFKILDANAVLPSVRAYRSHVRFEGAVHEDPGCNCVVKTPFVLRHQRAETAEARRDKERRYEEALLGELAASPTSLHALLYLRDLAFRRKEYPRAREYIAAILRQEDDYLCHFHLALIEHEEGRFASAVEHGFRALRASGLDPRVYVVIADAYARLDRRLEALAFYEHALHLPEEARLVGTRYALDEDEHHVVPLVNMAKVYVDLGLPAKAVACYEEALRRNPATGHFATVERNHAVLTGAVHRLERPSRRAPRQVTVVVPLWPGQRTRAAYTLGSLLMTPIVSKVVLLNGTGEPPPPPDETGRLVVVNLPEGTSSLNKAWNDALAAVDTEYYLLLEASILCRGSIVEACCNVLAQDPAVGALTVETVDAPLEAYAAGSAEPPHDLYLHSRFAPAKPQDGFLLGRTKDWVPIPGALQTFFGVEWALHQVRSRGSKTGKLVSDTIGQGPSTGLASVEPEASARYEEERAIYERLGRQP